MELIMNPSRRQQLVTELRRRLDEGVDLPVLPSVAQDLLHLRNRQDADMTDLVKVVEKDPVIAAQLLRYSRLSLFGYGERIKTLADAIQLVLGYEKSLYFALGLSAGRSLSVEAGGPLGTREFWRQALSCAVLAQSLAKELPAAARPNPGICYLAGLMHDIGYLLLASLYPEEFSILNRMVAKHSHIDRRELEFHCIGISHDMIGSCLMRTWQMPAEIITAVAEHHFPDFGGEHAIYAKLVHLADQLLRIIDDPQQVGRPWAAFEKAGLDQAAAQRALDSLHAITPDMEQMIEALAA